MPVRADGFGYHDVSDADRAEITALHPRPHFKRSILQAFTDGNARPRRAFASVMIARRA